MAPPGNGSGGRGGTADTAGAGRREGEEAGRHDTQVRESSVFFRLILPALLRSAAQIVLAVCLFVGCNTVLVRVRSNGDAEQMQSTSITISLASVLLFFQALCLSLALTTLIYCPSTCLLGFPSVSRPLLSPDSYAKINASQLNVYNPFKLLKLETL